MGLARRRFLLGLGAAAAVAPAAWRAGAAPGARLRIGYQIYSWGRHFPGDWWTGARAVGQIGFRGVEGEYTIAELYQGREAEFEERMDACGVRLAALYSTTDLERGHEAHENLRKNLHAAAFCERVGGAMIVIGGTHAEHKPAQAFAAFNRAADELGRRVFETHGVRCGVHPHVGSLVESREEIARVMDGTDPRAFSLAPDTGHLAAAGCDPVEVFETYRERIAHVHLKDYRRPEAPGARGGFAALGEGVVDFPALVRILESAGFDYFNAGVLDVNIDQFDVRLDTELREGRDSVFVRYSWSDTNRNEPPVLGPVGSGDFNSKIDVRAQSGVLGWSSVWGGSVFSEVRAAFNNIDGDTFHQAFGTPAASTFGIQGIPEDPRYSGGIPHTAVDGFTRFGGPFFRPQFQESSVLQLSGNVSWNTGNHAFKFGFERRRDQVRYLDLRALNGFMRFRNGRYSNTGLGDFLLGLSSQQGLTLFHEADIYTDGYAVFAQDSWRPTSNLTLNLGLRYEYFTPMQDKQNIMTNIDPATGQLFTSSDGDIFARALVRPDRNNIGPRVSFNWQPSERWVLKGGYGLFYQHTDRYGSESQLALNPPQLVDLFISANSGSETPVFLLRDGFVPISADDIDPTQVQWRIQDPDQKTPMVHQFSIGPEFRLTDDMTLSVEYVGNMVRNGRRLRNLNQGRIQADGSVVFPSAQFGYGTAFLEQIVTNGRANYHALQTQLQKRFRSGFGFTASFTWSKALADFLDHLAAGGGASGNTPQDASNMAADYGRAEFDVPRRFSLSFIYELPWGRDRRSQLNGVGGAILSDWSVNGILTLSDGRAFTVNASDQSGTGGGHTSRADCIGDPTPSGFDQTIDRWLDPAAFAEPEGGTFGDCGHGTVRGPGFKSLNLSLFRSFPLGGDRRLELRLEAFNVLNWNNFALPSSNISNLSSFGRITSTIGSPREMQVAVKLYF